MCYSHFSPLQVKNKPHDEDSNHALILGCSRDCEPVGAPQIDLFYILHSSEILQTVCLFLFLFWSNPLENVFRGYPIPLATASWGVQYPPIASSPRVEDVGNPMRYICHLQKKPIPSDGYRKGLPVSLWHPEQILHSVSSTSDTCLNITRGLPITSQAFSRGLPHAEGNPYATSLKNLELLVLKPEATASFKTVRGHLIKFYPSILPIHLLDLSLMR